MTPPAFFHFLPAFCSFAMHCHIHSYFLFSQMKRSDFREICCLGKFSDKFPKSLQIFHALMIKTLRFLNPKCNYIIQLINILESFLLILKKKLIKEWPSQTEKIVGLSLVVLHTGHSTQINWETNLPLERDCNSLPRICNQTAVTSYNKY